MVRHSRGAAFVSVIAASAFWGRSARLRRPLPQSSAIRGHSTRALGILGAHCREQRKRACGKVSFPRFCRGALGAFSRHSRGGEFGKVGAHNPIVCLYRTSSRTPPVCGFVEKEGESSTTYGRRKERPDTCQLNRSKPSPRSLPAGSRAVDRRAGSRSSGGDARARRGMPLSQCPGTIYRWRSVRVLLICSYLIGEAANNWWTFCL